MESRTNRMMRGARTGAFAGFKIGGAIALLILVLAVVTGTTFLSKWRMSVGMLSVVYFAGATMSGSVAGMLGVFATSRWRAYGVGVLSALPFALLAGLGRYGPAAPWTDLLVPASIWAAIVGGALGLLYHDHLQDRS